jgi:histidinol-phosphate/aromatic aminotransferase/cobyric acid decarboxylase-like protein
LGHFEARVYVISVSDQEVEALAQAMDHGEDEWLFSYPKYGEYATPVKVLIQQNRARLNQLRTQLESSEITTFNSI